jgi:uncharacterized membrane protein YuzA (DUF378 family)
MNDSPQQINNVNQLVTRIADIGTVIIYLLVGLAVVYIIWSVVQYFIKGKEGDEKRQQAGMQILWGIVGLAIVVSLWGLVNLIVNTFGTDTTMPNLPNADFVSSTSCPPGDYDPSCFSGSSQ